MRSVADDLRASSNRRILAMTPQERLALAFALGDEDVRVLTVTRGVSEADARRVFAEARRPGRVTSVAHDTPS